MKRLFKMMGEKRSVGIQKLSCSRWQKVERLTADARKQREDYTIEKKVAL